MSSYAIIKIIQFIRPISLISSLRRETTATVPLTTIEILAVLGINEFLARDRICDDMMIDPEGIGHLNVEDAEGIQSACSEYSKRTTAARRFTVTRVQKKLLTSWMYWAKDKRRLEEPTEFSNTHNEVMLRA